MFKDKFTTIKTSNNGEYLVWCSGCCEVHALQTIPSGHNAYYTFSGTMEKPTFKSLSEWTCSDSTKNHCCFYINAGIIYYHPNCSHHFCGMEVELREYKDWGGLVFIKKGNWGFNFKELP